jgi:putative transposase
VRHFGTVEELRQALLDFRETYNNTWLIERHGYLSPAAFRLNQLQTVAKAA